MTRAWGALERLRANGHKAYLYYSTFDPGTFEGGDWPHNPAGLYAMLADSAVAYYAYSGDSKVLDLVREALDYQLAHGLTLSDWPWGGVPYASATPGETTYQDIDNTRFGGNGKGDGPGVVEPDKIGELGLAYLRFFELTGDVRYQQAAITNADVLARHVRVGSATESPWLFVWQLVLISHARIIRRMFSVRSCCSMS